MNDDFQKCLKIGRVFEKKAQAKIIDYHKNKYYVENDTFAYDFKLSNGKFNEVKYCSLSNCSDIICLETIAFNRASIRHKQTITFS
jgi:predicted metal-binding protein